MSDRVYYHTLGGFAGQGKTTLRVSFDDNGIRIEEPVFLFGLLRNRWNVSMFISWHNVRMISRTTGKVSIHCGMPEPVELIMGWKDKKLHQALTECMSSL